MGLDLVITNLTGLANRHLSFIVITNPDTALAAEAVAPESLDRWRTRILLTGICNYRLMSTYVLDMLS